jgi:beta-lactamase superfamily II metal-dependent hydrolase
MLAIEMLPAGHGDALVVEYGAGSQRHRLLVDAGTFHSWGDVRARLLARRDPSYEVFVVTHVDEDHIGGAIALLDDPVLRDRVDQIWFNGFVHVEAGSSVLGPVHGEQLTERIANGPYRWNDPFPKRRTRGVGGPAVVPTADTTNADGSVGLPAFSLPGGARVVLLSPSGPKLKRMRTKWEDTVTEAGLVAGAGTRGHNKAPRPTPTDAPQEPIPITQQRLEQLAAERERDGSAANGSSIAFVLEFGGKRLLLGADAHADVLAKNLARYAAMVDEERPRIDLFKLPHHGSGANLSNELVAAIDCRRFLLSSNGDNYDHPDDTAIARALLGAPGPVTFFCNYDSPRTQPWVDRGRPVGATFTLPKPGKSGLRVSV